MVDTGGIELMSTDEIAVSIRQQAQIAIAEADVILFVCDARTGITNEDAEVAKLLRSSRKPVVLAVNKADSPKQEMDIYEFYNLGIRRTDSISAANHLNLGDLLDTVVEMFPQSELEGEFGANDEIKVAIYRPPQCRQVINLQLPCRQGTLIVRMLPAQQGSAIDTPVTRDGISFLFIDTAGMRRKARIDEPIEKLQHYQVTKSC
jgi:GTP-binding protein